MDKSLSITELVAIAHQTAEEKGWHEEPKKTFGDHIALICSEACEALDDYRKKNDDHIPEELADVCIRVFDMCGTYKIDLEKAIMDKMEKNKSRPYRHGNQRV